MKNFPVSVSAQSVRQLRVPAAQTADSLTAVAAETARSQTVGFVVNAAGNQQMIATAVSLVKV